ncbi:MAG: Na/Pi symporter [bacterium]
MNFSGLYIWLFCALLRAQDPLGNDISGDNQVGIAGQLLEKPVVVRVTDDNGQAVKNARVFFSVLHEPTINNITAKRISIEPETTYTDQDGYAKVQIRIGKGTGDYYIVARHNNDLLTFHFTVVAKNWLLVMVLFIIGGIALFIFGLNYGSKGLIRGAGSKTRDFLFNLTNNQFFALMSGLVTSIIMGSCTAAVSLLIKFASAGLVALLPALGVVLGANIGATITVQLLAFNIVDYALLIVALGVFLRILFPNLRNLAQFIFGFGLLFLSLKIMSDGVVNLKYLKGFDTMLEYLNQNAILGILLGVLFSVVFRSSIAVLGFILVLSFESLISLNTALILVLGTNLGATILPFFIADTAYGRRIALGNFLFKLVGLIICLLLLDYVAGLMKTLGGDIARQIANFHTIFNVFIALIFIPLIHPVSMILEFLQPETKKEILQGKRLDPAFLEMPAIGLGQALKEILFMADKTVKMLEDAIRVFERKDIALRKTIIQADDEIDAAEEAVTSYLSKLVPEEMDENLRVMQGGLLTTTAELEHVGDIISKNLMNYAKKQIDTGMVFSAEGFSEIREFHNFVLVTLRMAISSLTTRDNNLVSEVIKRRDVALGMAKNFEMKHLERLHRGLKESLETSAIHLDILSDLERINFHATEIANVVKGLK